MKSQLQIMLYSFLGFAGLEQASVVGAELRVCVRLGCEPQL